MDPANPVALSGPSCPACHAPNRDAARFCRACGKPLADRANTLAIAGLVLAIVAFVGWLALGAAAAASVQRDLTTASGWESWYRGWYRSDAQGAVAGVIVFGVVHLGQPRFMINKIRGKSTPGQYPGGRSGLSEAFVVGIIVEFAVEL